LEDKTDNKRETNQEVQEENKEEGFDFGWKFHRGPILIAAILTLIFYLCVLIFVK